MSDVAALIADMVRAGVDPELIGRTAATFAAKPVEVRTARQERNARYYQRKASEKRLITSEQDVSDDADLSPKEKSPTPPKEITPFRSEAKASSPIARGEFDAWYQHYPHKVQRGAAERAFVTARKFAALEDLIAGVHRYIASKPADRNWQNPATWLNGKGWLDAPADPPSPRTADPPAQREPRNAGERAFLKLQGQNHEPPSPTNGRLDPGDGRRQIEGSGVARRFASTAGAVP